MSEAITAFAPLQRLPVAKEDTVLEDIAIRNDAAEVTKRFGPLKVILGSIPADCANFQVRLSPPTQTLL